MEVSVTARIVQILERCPEHDLGIADCDGCVFTYRACIRCRRKLACAAGACVHCPPPTAAATKSHAAASSSSTAAAVAAAVRLHTYRYRMRCRVSDATGSASIIAFADACNSLFGCSAEQFHSFVHTNHVFSAPELYALAVSYLSGREFVFSIVDSTQPVVSAAATAAAAARASLLTPNKSALTLKSIAGRLASAATAAGSTAAKQSIVASGIKPVFHSAAAADVSLYNHLRLQLTTLLSTPIHARTIKPPIATGGGASDSALRAAANLRQLYAQPTPAAGTGTLWTPSAAAVTPIAAATFAAATATAAMMPPPPVRTPAYRPPTAGLSASLSQLSIAAPSPAPPPASQFSQPPFALTPQAMGQLSAARAIAIVGSPSLSPLLVAAPPRTPPRAIASTASAAAGKIDADSPAASGSQDSNEMNISVSLSPLLADTRRSNTTAAVVAATVMRDDTGSPPAAASAPTMMPPPVRTLSSAPALPLRRLELMDAVAVAASGKPKAIPAPSQAAAATAPPPSRAVRRQPHAQAHRPAIGKLKLSVVSSVAPRSAPTPAPLSDITNLPL